MGHAWNDTLTAINGGKMNQFDLVQFGNIDGDYMSDVRWAWRCSPSEA